MSDRIDHLALFKQVTGRDMMEADANKLRDFLRLAPKALAESPTYVADLMVRHDQWFQLRKAISDASDSILTQVQARSQVAVERMVDDTVRRIHESSPNVEIAFYKAFVAFIVSVTAAFLLAFALFAVLFSFGWVRPQWFTAESYSKIRFAEAVQASVGHKIDWTQREGRADQSLLDVVTLAQKIGTNNDPEYRMRLHESCRATNQVAYSSRGRRMCRFEIARH